MKQEAPAVAVCHLSPASRVWSPHSDDRHPEFDKRQLKKFVVTLENYLESFGASFPSLHILVFLLIPFYELINHTSPDTRSCLVWSLGVARLKKICIQSRGMASVSCIKQGLIGVYSSGSSQQRCSKRYLNCRPELNRIFGKGEEMGHCACLTTVEEGTRLGITTSLATCSTGIFSCHRHLWQFPHESVYTLNLLGHQELGESAVRPRHPRHDSPHPRA